MRLPRVVFHTMRGTRGTLVTWFAWCALACIGCSSGVGSVGAILGRDNDTRALYVREAPRGLGAATAGLRPGDEIVMIEGFYVKDLTAAQIRSLLRGEVGSHVQLTVVRGEAVLRIRIERSALGTTSDPKEREEKLVE